MGQPIQTRIRLLFSKDEKDVTEDLAPDLLAFSFDDKEAGEADEISITLKDETGKWAGTWQPDGMEHVRAFILQGNTEKIEKELPCGKFFIDEMSTSGSPRTFQMKAVSTPLDKPCRKKINSRAWERVYLSDIALEIANGSGMKPLWSGRGSQVWSGRGFQGNTAENPFYERVDQRRESDLKFLSRLCEEAGALLKVTDSKILIIDNSFYKNAAPVMTVELGKSNIISWSFSSSQSETYKSCTISYYNVSRDRTYKFTAYSEYTDGQEYSMKEVANNINEAKRLANSKLLNLNVRKLTGSMTLVGDIALCAGSVIECKGFGSFDGNFIIERASHNIQGGYTTAVDLRRVDNTNYGSWAEK